MGVRMSNECLARLRAAREHLNQSGRKVIERLHPHQHRDGRQFGRLDDDRVSRCQCGGGLPTGEEHREVVRHDGDDGAERLLQHHVQLAGNRWSCDSALFTSRCFRIVTER